VLERFDEVGLIDDAAFAGQWVRSRHTQRGLARRAIAMELRRKGVSDEDAGEALAEVDTESEERRARELVDRKMRSLALGTAEQRAAAGRRLVGMLARKGYGAGIAYRVVKEALAERGAEADKLGEGQIPED
jgi:regulatory protein